VETFAFRACTGFGEFWIVMEVNNAISRTCKIIEKGCFSNCYGKVLDFGLEKF